MVDAWVLALLYFIVPAMMLFGPGYRPERLNGMGVISVLIVCVLWLPVLMWMWYRGKKTWR